MNADYNRGEIALER